MHFRKKIKFTGITYLLFWCGSWIKIWFFLIHQFCFLSFSYIMLQKLLIFNFLRANFLCWWIPLTRLIGTCWVCKSFSFAYSILYRIAGIWLQHLVCSAVQEQKPVITKPLILKRIHSWCFRSLILWEGVTDDLIMLC